MRSPIDHVDSFLGKEIMYGSLCFQLLFDVIENEKYLVDRGVPNVLLEGMKRQKSAQVAQHLVLTAVEYCRGTPSMCVVFADIVDGPAIASELVLRGLTEVADCHPSEVKDLMKPRLKLVQYMAHNRKVFAKTSIMDHLAALWNDSDEYYFGEVRHRSLEELKRLHKREKRDQKIETIGTALLKGLGRNESTASLMRSPSQSPLQRKRSMTGLPSGRRLSLASINGGGSRRGSAGSHHSRVSMRDQVATPRSRRRASTMQRKASMVALSPSRSRKQSMVSLELTISLSMSEDSFVDENEEWPSEYIDQGPVMLPHILKTMRKVVCGQFVRPIKAVMN